MRIINDNCIPSVTEIMRAAAHCRALAARAAYNGCVAAYWDLDDGSVSYHDFVGGGWLDSRRRVEIARAEAGRGLLYAGTAADKHAAAERVRAEMLHAVQHLSAADGWVY
nr:MAG TPA: hypothetical protein [Caudoviricetes sp.]